MVCQVLKSLLFFGVLLLLALPACRSDEPPKEDTAKTGESVDPEAGEAGEGRGSAADNRQEAETSDPDPKSPKVADEAPTREEDEVANNDVEAPESDKDDPRDGSECGRDAEAVSDEKKPPIPDGLEVRRLDRKTTTNYRMEVLESTIAREVEDRKPQGRGRRFDADVGQVWAWVKVSNRGDEANPITMIWKHEGKQRFKTELNVGVSKGWRTWTRKKIAKDQTGEWRVEVRDPSGSLLDELKFTIGPGDSPAAPSVRKLRGFEPPRKIR